MGWNLAAARGEVQSSLLSSSSYFPHPIPLLYATVWTTTS